LIENTLGEFFAVATFEHAVNQLRFKVIESAAFLPGGHSAPKLISLSGTEACGHHGQLDHLFLKNRDTQGALQHAANAGACITDRFQPLTSAQIWMHHVPLNRSRADDGDFDH